MVPFNPKGFGSSRVQGNDPVFESDIFDHHKPLFAPWKPEPKPRKPLYGEPKWQPDMRIRPDFMGPRVKPAPQPARYWNESYQKFMGHSGPRVS